MAESKSGQEKTEQATPKKLQDARNEAQVPRSRELNTIVMLLASCMAFLMLGGGIVDGLMQILRNSFSFNRQQIFDDNSLPSVFWDSIVDGVVAVAPFFAVMLVAAICAPLLMGGFTFSAKALTPKLEKLDPIKGLKKLIAWKGLVELLKSLAKFVLVGTVGFFVLKSKLGDFSLLGVGAVNYDIALMGSELLWVYFLLCLALIVIVALDIPFQIWDFNRQQKMTLQEVKDESKDTDGNPEVKGKIRSLQMEIAKRRMMEQVPDADVIVTNPSHYSVALKYDQLGSAAPIVVALGADLVALQIRKVANAHDVPILESPALARALYHSSELNQEIPAGLYMAVAQVLAYIYQLRNYRSNGGLEPQLSTDIPIPDDLRRD